MFRNSVIELVQQVSYICVSKYSIYKGLFIIQCINDRKYSGNQYPQWSLEFYACYHCRSMKCEFVGSIVHVAMVEYYGYHIMSKRTQYRLRREKKTRNYKGIRSSHVLYIFISLYGKVHITRTYGMLKKAHDQIKIIFTIACVLNL